MMIQIETVGYRTDPSDYWDEFTTDEFEAGRSGRQETAFIADSDSMEEVIETADSDSLIVDKSPNELWDHPDADLKIRVYDGYNE